MKKFVLKPGSFEEKKTGQKQPGLDLSRTVLDTLVDKGILTTEDCCVYEILNSASDFMTRMSSIQVVTDDVTLDGTIGTTIVNNDDDDVTITLPSAVLNIGMRLHVVRGPGSTGSISVDSADGDLQEVDSGGLSATVGVFPFNNSYPARNTYQSNGTDWYLIGN